MSKLILIKHARPQKDDTRPAHDWSLSDEGRRLSGVLAEQLRPHALGVIVSSPEPKAQQTAEIIAQALGIPTEVEADLAEHDRSSVPLMPTREFISMMALLFNRPRQCVLGGESAEQALKRFSRAIDRLLDRHGQRNLAIVSHGTVLALYAARLLETDPFTLWRQMAQPAYLIFQRPNMDLLLRQDRLDPPAPSLAEGHPPGSQRALG